MKTLCLYLICFFCIVCFSQDVDDFDFTITDQYSEDHNIATCLRGGMHVLLSITGTG